MKTKDLPKIAAGQLADSDCLLADCAAQGTGLVPFAVLSDYHIKRTGVWPSNPNLLINADFRNPVNRNGQSEYTASGYTIDKWKNNNANGKIVYQNNKIIFSCTNSSNMAIFLQPIPTGSLIPEQYYTASVLTNLGLSYVTFLSGAHSEYINIASGIRLRYEVWESNDQILVRIDGIGTIELYAFKLELGNQQTLAHQDEDGNWVLNEPPNFDLQYALCSQYSPSTGEFVGSQHSNPNLLDNWYFADPINQRGQTEYTASGYTIDRWRIWSGVESVTLHNGYITLTALDNANGYYRQTLSENLSEYLFGKIVSLSFLFQNNEFTTITGTIPNGTIQFLQTLYSKGAIFMRNENGVLSVTISAQPANFTEIIAAKLELGPVQTLAHKEGDVWVLNDPPPVKSVELAKCQEYQFVVGGGNNRHIGTFEIGTSGNKIFTRIAVTLPTTQRKSTPAVKILGSGSLRLVQIANQIKAFGTISSTQQPESVFLSENCCYITYETPGLTAGMTGMVDTTNVSTFLCIDNNL